MLFTGWVNCRGVYTLCAHLFTDRGDRHAETSLSSSSSWLRSAYRRDLRDEIRVARPLPNAQRALHTCAVFFFFKAIDEQQNTCSLYMYTIAYVNVGFDKASNICVDSIERIAQHTSNRIATLNAWLLLPRHTTHQRRRRRRRQTQQVCCCCSLVQLVLFSII